MNITNFDFANLTPEQQTMLKNFEKDLTTKFGKDVYLLAFNKK